MPGIARLAYAIVDGTVIRTDRAVLAGHIVVHATLDLPDHLADPDLGDDG